MNVEYAEWIRHIQIRKTDKNEFKTIIKLAILTENDNKRLIDFLKNAYLTYSDDSVIRFGIVGHTFEKTNIIFKNISEIEILYCWKEVTSGSYNLTLYDYVLI
jgi:hypothetical protein